jgi:hypothetical protein
MTMIRSGLQPLKDTKRLQAVLSAIERLTEVDLRRYQAWTDLTDLSYQTTFDSIESSPEAVFADEAGRFDAAATIYVNLSYGTGADSEDYSDSYPATVSGSIDVNGNVQINSVSADVSSFYEDGDKET